MRYNVSRGANIPRSGWSSLDNAPISVAENHPQASDDPSHDQTLSHESTALDDASDAQFSHASVADVSLESLAVNEAEDDDEDMDTLS